MAVIHAIPKRIGPKLMKPSTRVLPEDSIFRLPRITGQYLVNPSIASRKANSFDESCRTKVEGSHCEQMIAFSISSLRGESDSGVVRSVSYRNIGMPIRKKSLFHEPLSIHSAIVTTQATPNKIKWYVSIEISDISLPSAMVLPTYKIYNLCMVRHPLARCHRGELE